MHTFSLGKATFFYVTKVYFILVHGVSITTFLTATFTPQCQDS